MEESAEHDLCTADMRLSVLPVLQHAPRVSSCTGASAPQAGDLRRLLALYQGWHRRVFPFTTFDGFLEDLEKLGATAAFKARWCRTDI